VTMPKTDERNLQFSVHDADDDPILTLCKQPYTRPVDSLSFLHEHQS
jgi:hypothetical protein